MYIMFFYMEWECQSNFAKDFDFFLYHYTYAEPNKYKKGLINFTIQAVVRGDYILILLAFPAKGKLQCFSIKMYMYFQMSLGTPSLCPMFL